MHTDVYCLVKMYFRQIMRTGGIAVESKIVQIAIYTYCSVIEKKIDKNKTVRISLLLLHKATYSYIIVLVQWAWIADMASDQNDYMMKY